MEQMIEQVRAFVLQEFLPGENPGDFTSTTPLFSSGLLDSLASLKLVEFLEQEFGITVAAHDIVPENLDNLELIVRFVQSKLAAV